MTTTTTTSSTNNDDSITVSNPDAIIVGSGLAGLTVALHMLDRGGKVIVVEKEPKVGGNTMKASSGINSIMAASDDSAESFKRDTMQSAGSAAREELIDVLVQQSGDVIEWLKTRVGLQDLQAVGHLGGHSVPRTLRPASGSGIGFELISHLQKEIQLFPPDKVQILVRTKVQKLLQNDDHTVTGIQYERTIEEKSEDCVDCTRVTTTHGELKAPSVVLATGGFAADRSEGSLLAKYQPQWLKMGATAGDFSTGDGIQLGMATHAATVDMEKVQVHPTGFVDSKDPNNPSKFLAAELLRGVGGILLDGQGKRFCNELGTRAYVTDKMFSLTQPEYATTHQWDPNTPIPTFYLLLSEEAATACGKHMGFYQWKGLMQKIEGGIDGLAKYMQLDTDDSTSVLQATLEAYERAAAATEKDEFDKTIFHNPPKATDTVFFVGQVQPVLHYCMGGLKINTHGNVLCNDNNNEDKIIPNLYACGEVAGGVHGDNRLGGNSLLECAVFGTVIGKSLPITSNTN